jgi:hypothetical protein
MAKAVSRRQKADGRSRKQVRKRKTKTEDRRPGTKNLEPKTTGGFKFEVQL